MRYFVVALSTVLASAAAAQTLNEIDRRDAAVVEAWKATPLTLRRAFFTTEHPTGFGQYAERPNNVFKPGEKLISYAEPVGYGWKDIGDGETIFGFKVDLTIKNADGKILNEQKDFADLSLKSHAHNREFDVVLTLNLTGVKPGDYMVEYTLHDIASDKTGSFTLPFKIAE
jgi:hypothetical protein